VKQRDPPAKEVRLLDVCRCVAVTTEAMFVVSCRIPPSRLLLRDTELGSRGRRPPISPFPRRGSVFSCWETMVSFNSWDLKLAKTCLNLN